MGVDDWNTKVDQTNKLPSCDVKIAEMAIEIVIVSVKKCVNFHCYVSLPSGD